jgi:hypothetical protein
MGAGVRWGVAVITAAGLSAGMVVAAPVETMSVGDLAVRLARTVGAPASATLSEASAAAFLGRHGLAMGKDLSRPVLGSDLIVFGRAIGATVTTSQPAAAATPAQVSAFVGVARGSILGTQASASGLASSKEDGINASCRGREARDGRHGTPASPADPNATAPPCDGEGLRSALSR